DNAGKFGQNAVAGEFNDATVVLRDPRVDYFAANLLQLRERAGFICPHEAAVTDHVGCENRGQATFHESSEYAPEKDRTSRQPSESGGREDYRAVLIFDTCSSTAENLTQSFEK